MKDPNMSDTPTASKSGVFKDDLAYETIPEDVARKERVEDNEELIELKKKWSTQQEVLRSKVIKENTMTWQDNLDGGGLKFVGGVDISFIVGDDKNACAAYVVLEYPSLNVVYEEMKMVHVTAPYVAGYLAFREASHAEEMIRRQIEEHPEVTPQVILMDGNGRLHRNRCGIACHVGVTLDFPMIGVAKNLYQIPEEGIARDDVHQHKIDELRETGDFFLLQGDEGEVLGAAVKPCEGAKKPVYVSIGHRIDLETAREVVVKCSKYRVPEPTRQADIRSREYLRKTDMMKK